MLYLLGDEDLPPGESQYPKLSPWKILRWENLPRLGYGGSVRKADRKEAQDFLEGQNEDNLPAEVGKYKGKVSKSVIVSKNSLIFDSTDNNDNSIPLRKLPLI